MEIKYLLKKIKNSWTSDTFSEKSIRFLVNKTKRYIFITFINLIHSTNKLELNLIDGYKDHRLDKDFLEIKTDQIAKIVEVYKRAKLGQKKVSPEYEISGLWHESDFNFHKIDGTFSKNLIGSKLIPNSNNFKTTNSLFA